MSLHRPPWYASCNVCTNGHDTQRWTKKEALADLRNEGWKVKDNGERIVCPKCQKEEDK